MPPEVPTEFRVVCCKSQGISSGIMELGKIKCAFGSGIARRPLARGVQTLKQVFQPSLLPFRVGGF